MDFTAISFLLYISVYKTFVECKSFTLKNITTTLLNNEGDKRGAIPAIKQPGATPAIKLSVMDRIIATNDEDGKVDDYFFSGDIRAPMKFVKAVLGQNVADKRNLIWDNTGIWPRYSDNNVNPHITNVNNVYIPFAFTGGDKEVSDEVKGMFREATGWILHKSCVQIHERNEQELINKGAAFVSVEKGVGCHATVGKFRNGGEISLGEGCNDYGVIFHEIMHVLGFHHEHNRIDRDDYIAINWDNIEPRLQNRFTKYFNGRMVTENGKPLLPYDTRSIMHYESDAMAKAPGLQTISEKNPDGSPNTNTHANFGTRMISDLDLDKINMVYYCDGVFENLRDDRSRAVVNKVMETIHGSQNQQGSQIKDHWNAVYTDKDDEPHRFG